MTAVGSENIPGDPVKAKITANNGYGDVTSAVNADSAVYQTEPDIYNGDYTVTNVQDDWATISWDSTFYADAENWGYAPITSYIYGYWKGTDAVTYNTTSSKFATIETLVPGELYTFFVQGLNAYLTTDTYSTQNVTTFTTTIKPDPVTLVIVTWSTS